MDNPTLTCRKQTHWDNLVLRYILFESLVTISHKRRGFWILSKSRIIPLLTCRRMGCYMMPGWNSGSILHLKWPIIWKRDNLICSKLCIMFLCVPWSANECDYHATSCDMSLAEIIHINFIVLESHVSRVLTKIVEINVKLIMITLSLINSRWLLER